LEIKEISLDSEGLGNWKVKKTDWEVKESDLKEKQIDRKLTQK
jgi:hypothetical protein